MSEKPLSNEKMDARRAISEQAKRERDWRQRTGRDVPSQEKMERVYRDALNNSERKKGG